MNARVKRFGLDVLLNILIMGIGLFLVDRVVFTFTEKAPENLFENVKQYQEQLQKQSSDSLREEIQHYLSDIKSQARTSMYYLFGKFLALIFIAVILSALFTYSPVIFSLAFAFIITYLIFMLEKIDAARLFVLHGDAIHLRAYRLFFGQYVYQLWPVFTLIVIALLIRSYKRVA